MYGKHNHSTYLNWGIYGQYEKIPNCLRELMSNYEKERRKFEGLKDIELEQMELKFDKLKEIAKKNYILGSELKGNKGMFRILVYVIQRLSCR